MSFTKSAVLPVSPDEAFALITDPERLRRWKAVTATVDLRAGGSYRFTVLPGHVAEGTYHEVEPGRRVVFGWGWDDDPDLPKDASTVTITVEPVEGGSKVTLVHEGLNAEQAVAHAEGWNHFFERLERLATTGDAGQDEWAWAPDHLTPLFAAEAALAVIQPMLRNLTPEDRPKPTPCADFTAHELAEHLLGSIAQVGGMAGHGAVAVPDHGSLEDRVSVVTGEAVAAWRKVDLDGTVPGPGGAEMPAAFLASILPLELLLHGWDLAQASGQHLRVSDDVADYISELSRGVVAQGRGSSFGDEVTPDADADAVERFAAYAGRRPIHARPISA
jgi:uncharacterized protein (TIGR03086 family)